MTLNVTDETFATEVLGSDVPVLVDFWAEWCPPCHRIAPVLEDLAVEYEGRARIVKLDADVNPLTPMKYGVMSMPTLSMFRNGEVVSQVVGARSKTQLRAQIDAALEG
jgi:thioredoxin 1